MEVLGQERAQFLTVLRPATKKALARRYEVVELFVILVVQNLLLEKTSTTVRSNSNSENSPANNVT